MKLYRVVLALFLIIPTFLNSAGTSLASSNTIRVTGFNDDRSFIAFADRDGSPISDNIVGTSVLIQSLLNSSNFGSSGTVSCGVDIQPFVSEIWAGQLVNSNGERLADVFLGGTTDWQLSDSEADELAKFVKAGGVVHVSGGTTEEEATSYNPLFGKLGIADSFSGDIDFSSFEGDTNQPANSPVINGGFGNIGPMTHSPFSIINTSSLNPLAIGFQTGGIVIMSTQTLGIGMDETILAEGEVEGGYLSVAGAPMYIDGYTGVNSNNLNYFLNLIGYACTDNSSSDITAFLDLPWDYGKYGLGFSEAALFINSYFDHEYPLLSVGSVLSEPEEAKGILAYDNIKSFRRFYSSHDAYDWGSRAGAKYRDSVLASADGTATFSNSCKPCGNAIYIDHGNGYQTRYYHLMSEGLIVNKPNESVQVTRGQKIGQVGFSGRVIPAGERGAHIHFMVVQDKDGDDNFSDNIPDGLTDPFGWQSADPDPWPNYSFYYKGVQRTGNTSYYLWRDKIENLNESLPANGGVFNLGRISVDLPAGSGGESVQVEPTTLPPYSVSFESIVLPYNVNVIDASGNFVSSFVEPITITFDLENVDIDRLLKDSISIYSSDDGENWNKENTIIDWVSNLASADVYHLSYFTLAGEPADTIPPETKITLAGEEGEIGWFRSNVSVTLTPDDKKGSGVDYTAYRVNDGEWEEYIQAFEFELDGEYTIFFYSVDKDENIEETKEITINIDKEIPEAEIYFNPNSRKIEISPLNKEDSVETKQRRWKRTTYTLSDKAGNYLEINTIRRKHKHSDTITINYLKYSDGTKVSHFPNNLHIKYKYRKGELYKLSQLWIKEWEMYKFNYKAKTDKSKIIIRRKKERERIIEDGLKLLYLTTDNGNLSTEYR